jgi:ATP-dependent DNA helicase PIF1
LQPTEENVPVVESPSQTSLLLTTSTTTEKSTESPSDLISVEAEAPLRYSEFSERRDGQVMSESSASIAISDDVLEERAPTSENNVPCEDIGGQAGCGKTTLVKQRIEDDPEWGLLTATTGISAINLNAVTLNSTLGFFDTDSLKDLYLTGRLATKLHDLGKEHRNLVIDEKSMMDAVQLDLIYRAMSAANAYADVKTPMGIVLVGDFAQLPPIKAKWAFEAECWPQFEANRTHLTKIWRQDQLAFLDALNAARRGDGLTASDILSSVGVQWETSLDTDYEGTTLVPKNDQVDRFNQMKLDSHTGSKFTVSSRRWGQQRPEWAKGVPWNATFKVGCYVMILSNSKMEEGAFKWVNGDCGHVESFDGDEVAIRLVRTGQTVTVPKLCRNVTAKDKPEGWDSTIRQDGYVARLHRDTKGKYVVGQIEWFPLRLAYASTVHKSQGLSLDKLQIDFRNAFFAHPGMLYVALSRCRTLEGLRLVGQRERFVKQCNADVRVQRWL